MIAGYRLILPRPWIRLPVGEGAEAAVRELVRRRTSQSDLPPDQLGPLRRRLERQLLTQVGAARDAGAVDLFIPEADMHGLLVGASFVVSEAVLPGGLEAADEPDLIRRLLVADGATPLVIDGTTWSRAEEIRPPVDEVDVPRRHVSYLGPRPDDGGPLGGRRLQLRRRRGPRLRGDRGGGGIVRCHHELVGLDGCRHRRDEGCLMFGRKRSTPAVTARAALRETRFPVRTAPGVAAIVVDYDPAIWIRLPHEGEDRTAWVERHLDAYAADADLVVASDAYLAAEVALNAAADRHLTHTCDLMALQAPDLGNAVAYLNLVDEELGLLEHGAPEVFLTMADVKLDGPVPKPRWNPIGRVAKAYRLSHAAQLAPGAPVSGIASDKLARAHLVHQLPEHPDVHLYGSIFYARPSGMSALMRLFARTTVELSDGALVPAGGR